MNKNEEKKVIKITDEIIENKIKRRSVSQKSGGRDKRGNCPKL